MPHLDEYCWCCQWMNFVPKSLNLAKIKPKSSGRALGKEFLLLGTK
jgi:hypothetical protein